MLNAETHPYYQKYELMRKLEYKTFSQRSQTLMTLMCWDMKLAWFKLSTRREARNFIELFGEDALMRICPFPSSKEH